MTNEKTLTTEEVKALGNRVAAITDIISSVGKPGGDIATSTYDGLIKELDDIALELINNGNPDEL